MSQWQISRRGGVPNHYKGDLPPPAGPTGTVIDCSSTHELATYGQFSFRGRSPRTAIFEHTNTYRHSFILGRRPSLAFRESARIEPLKHCIVLIGGLIWRCCTFYSQAPKTTPPFLLLLSAPARRRAFFLRRSVTILGPYLK